MTDEKKPAPPIMWPAIGSKWTDGTRDFATSMGIFEVIWKSVDGS